MGGSRSGTSTTTIDKLPDEIEQEYAIPYINRAKALFMDKDHFDIYEFQTYADQPQDEIDGITMLADRGRFGDVLVAKGNSYLSDVLDKNFLDGTHSDFDLLIDKVINKPKADLRNNVLNLLVGSAYFINDLSSINMSKVLVDDDRYYDRASKVIYAENYRNEKIRLDSAVPISLEYGRQKVVDAETLRTAGLYQRIYNQGGLDDAYKVYYEEQTSITRRLDVYGNAIRSVMGTQTAIDRPYYRMSPVIGAVGGAMAGAASGLAAGSMYGSGGGPWGAAIGAVIGGVVGYLGSQ